MNPLARPRVPACVLTPEAEPALADGHAVDLYVEIGSLTKVGVRLLAERRLGDPAPSGQEAGPLRRHNGAARHAPLLTGAMKDGSRVLVHRLDADSDATDRLGAEILGRGRAGAARAAPPADS